MARDYYAHVPSNPVAGEIVGQLIRDHADGVLAAGLAILKRKQCRFIRKQEKLLRLGLSAFAHFHDIAKYKIEFQRYLLGQLGSDFNPDAKAHTPMAVWLLKEIEDKYLPGKLGMLLHWVGGHHGGMRNSHNVLDAKEGAYVAPTLDDHIKFAKEVDWGICRHKPHDILKLALADDPSFQADALYVLPKFVQEVSKLTPEETEWVTRIGFALCIASDWKDTNEYSRLTRTDGSKHRKKRHYRKLEAGIHLKRILTYIKRLSLKARKLASPTGASIIEFRDKWLQEAMTSARLVRAPAVLGLTIPTGGAKTLIGLAVAYLIAKLRGCDKVIYIGPYCSIISQNADVFRKAIGKDRKVGKKLRRIAKRGKRYMIELHSWVHDPEKDPTDEGSKNNDLVFEKMLDENWYHALVASTTVQLGESMFSPKGGRSQKILNLMNAVVIIDEYQNWPIKLRNSFSDVLKLLPQLGSYPILMSATPVPWPEICGGIKVKELVPVKTIPDVFRRVKVRWGQEWTFDDVVERLRTTHRLMVFNTVRLTQDVAKAAGSLCLNGMQIDRHRKEILRHVKANQDTARLASTQIIQCGVDVDMPPDGARQMAPFDAVGQAAGRVNRSGRFGIEGAAMDVFKLKQDTIEYHDLQDYAPGIKIVEQLLAERGGHLDIYDHETVKEYFVRLHKAVTDDHVLNQMRKDQQHREVERECRHILKHTHTVVAYRQKMNEVKGVTEQQEVQDVLSSDRSPKWKIRRLRPFMCQVQDNVVKKLMAKGEMRPILDDKLYLYTGEYDEVVGIPSP